MTEIPTSDFKFEIHPFYYFKNSGCCYRTNDIVQIVLKRHDLISILEMMECLMQIYDVSNYENWTIIDLDHLLEDKLLVFWNKFIKPVMENNEVNNNVSMQAFINMVAGNFEALKKTLNSIFICMTLLKKFGCSYNIAHCKPIKTQQTDDDNVLKTTIENYWNILDEILFFRPIFSIDQNLIVLLVQIFVLNNATSFVNHDDDEKSNVQPKDAAFNRLGCFIQHWLLQGKDNEVSNIYNEILYEEFFTNIAMELRKYITTNKTTFHVQIKNPSLKITDDQMHAVILSEKKGFMKSSEDFITFVDEKIKKSLTEKYHIKPATLDDLNFGMTALFLLYKGFCTDICFNQRHINILKTQCMMQLNGIISNESIITNCMDLVLSENFVTESTIKKWSMNKCLILLKEAYNKKQKYQEKSMNGKTVVIKNK